MARDFDGTDDRIDWANVFTTSGQALTVAAWLYPDDLNRATQQYIFHGTASGGGVGTVFGIMDNSANAGGLRFVRITSATAKARTSSTSILTAGVWQHVAMTDDGSLTAANCILYRDGTEVGSYGETLNGSGTETTANSTWSLGGRTLDNNRNLNGRLAEVGVWNRQLSVYEILALGKGWSPLLIPNGLRFYTPLWGNTSESNYLGAASTTTVGTIKQDHPQKSLIYPQQPRFFDPAEAAAPAGHPAMRRFGGTRFVRDIPVGIGGVRTF